MAWYWKTVNTELNRGEQIQSICYLRMRFEDLFDGTPGLDMVALFWTVNAQFAIQPGTTRSGFLIGSHGHFLSSRALPFVDLGPGGEIATGNLTVVGEPSGAMLAGVGLAGCGLWQRTRRRQRPA